MKTNVYLHEVRMRLRSALYWSLGILAIHVVYISLFPSWSEQGAVINQALQNFPREFRMAFGIMDVDVTTLTGYYIFVYLFTQICMAIQAGGYGVGLVSIEESERTADFLLSKPVARLQIMNAKVLAALSVLLLTNAATWVSAFGTIWLFAANEEYDARILALMLAGLIVFQVFFLCVGLAISLLVPRVRSVTPYALGLGFGMYVLGAFSGLLGDVKLEYITPFKHFEGAYIVRNHGFDMRLFWLNVAISVIALAIAYWRYHRRDIPTVV